MPAFSRHDVIASLLDVGLLPVFYNGNIDVAENVVRACAEGGAKVMEFTNRGDRAYQVFSELSRYCTSEIPNLVIGVGTIVDPATAALYINCGANFIVGPVLNEEIAKVCNRRKVAYIPGCITPSEISRAEELGVSIIKVFPAKVVTSAFVKALLGPCPWSRLMPSGGVKATKEDVFNWIESGAAALNMGSNLISKDLVKAGDYDAIRKRVKQCIQWVREARASL